VTSRAVLRKRYAPARRDLLEEMERRGLDVTLLERRTARGEDITALVGFGLVSSAHITAGQDIWHLRLTRLGQAVRRLLLREMERA